MNGKQRTPFSLSGKQKWLILFIFFGIVLVTLWPLLYSQEAQFVIAVNYDTIPHGLTVVGTPIKDIEVKIRGAKSLIESLSKLNSLHYDPDLSNVDIGINSIPVSPSKFPFPKGISVVQINPSFLTIKIDSELEKSVPVVVTLSGKPATGFFIADAIADPAKVILKGPESILRSIETINTKPVEISGAREPLKREIALDLAEDIHVVTPEGNILSEVFIEEKVITKQLQDIPVEGKDALYNFSITPRVVSLEVKGPENILERLSMKNGIEVFLDLEGLKPGVYVRHATIRLPVNTTLVGVKPEIFTVRLENEP